MSIDKVKAYQSLRQPVPLTPHPISRILQILLWRLRRKLMSWTNRKPYQLASMRICKVRTSCGILRKVRPSSASRSTQEAATNIDVFMSGVIKQAELRVKSEHVARAMRKEVIGLDKRNTLKVILKGSPPPRPKRFGAVCACPQECRYRYCITKSPLGGARSSRCG